MLLRAIARVRLINAACSPAYRPLSCSSFQRSDKSSALEQQDETPTKFQYTEPMREPVVMNLNEPLEKPLERTARLLKYDASMGLAYLQGKKPPPNLGRETDILIIGGGIVGSSIAYHLLDRCGPELKISILEKDPPELSSSLAISNYLYQQVKSQPNFEMVSYAAQFYRKLGLVFDDPDLPSLPDIHFTPTSSLMLASESEVQELEDLSSLYKDNRWKHQLLSSTMLKQKFPWMNTEGVALASLGMNGEGFFNQSNALKAVRAVNKKNRAQYFQGKLIGFEFIDQTEYSSQPSLVVRSFSPRRAVIESPDGEIRKCQFAYVILAPGASLHEVCQLFNIGDINLDFPIKPRKMFSYEILCPNGPGIDMPLIMENSGLRVGRNDILDTYTVWDENYCDSDVEKLEADEKYFTEKLLPQLVKRVPSFRDAKLTSSKVGLIDKSTWDDHVFVGPPPHFFNVLLAGGFGQNEFMFGPATGQGISDLILDREFVRGDLSCFRLERIAANIKLNMELPPLERLDYY